MITINELLSNQCEFDDLNEDLQSNLMELHKRINVIRTAYDKPMIVSSGFRSMAHHLDIYKRKGITDINRIPLKSSHLYAKAVDISDPKQELQKFILNHIELIESTGLWFESFAFTKTWVHAQISPPLSGRRFFMP